MISNKIYEKRRAIFFEKMLDNSIAILSASPTYLRNNDIEYPFRQNSDLLYLTGFSEPRSVAVFDKSEIGNRFILFCMDRDPEVEQWVGYRFGQTGALEKFGADEAYSINEIDQHIPNLMLRKDRVYHAYGRNFEFDQRVIGWMNKVRSQLRSGFNIPGEIINLEGITHEMRIIKEEEEINLLQKSADINVGAFLNVIPQCKPGMFEYDLVAMLSYYYQKHGALELSFGAIVGSGENSTILHYEHPRSQLKEGDLVLVDAGCVFGDYPSDITRTIPVNGKFSKEQRAIYELVLKMQLVGIEKLRPGNNYYAAQEAAICVATEGLCELDLLKGNVDDLVREEAYKPFYMHKFSHWIGLDVHDPSAYKVNDQWRTLQPGMLMSAEPGIYIKPGLKGVDKKWWNIGVRIEDEVLITNEGYRVLTNALPKKAEEIEALMTKKTL